MYSRQRRRREKRLVQLKQTLSLFMVGLMSLLSVKLFNQGLRPRLAVADTQTAAEKTMPPLEVEPLADVVSELELSPPSGEDVSVAQQVTEPSQELPVAPTVQQETVVLASYQPVVQAAPVAVTPASYPTVLANGNTAGSVGTQAAARMAAATGVPQATWEYIIARESNGDPTVANPSGAAGLFQTIPGWGSTATVEDQINTAIHVYNNQGLAAWGMQ